MTVVIVATWGECGAPQVAPLSGQFPANLVEVRPVLDTYRVLKKKTNGFVRDAHLAIPLEFLEVELLVNE